MAGNTDGYGAEKNLTLHDFKEILNVLKVSLPEGALNQQVVTNLSNINIADAEAIKEDLLKGQLHIAVRPRLASGKVAKILKLKEENKVQEITRLIFFRKHKDSEESLKDLWGKNATNIGLQIKDTSNELHADIVPTAERSEPGPDLEKENNVLLKFNVETRGSNPDYYIKHHGVEFGFLSGRLDVPVEFREDRSSESSTPLIKSKVMECKVIRQNVVGGTSCNHSKGQNLEIKMSRQQFYRILTHKFLQESMNDPPVSAVMVINNEEETEEDQEEEPENIYYGTMSKDTSEIKELYEFCQTAVLPLFLSVLNLSFTKVNVQELQKENQELQKENQKLQKGNQELKEKIKELQKGNQEHREKIQEHREKIQEHQKQTKKLEKKIQEHQRKTKELEEKIQEQQKKTKELEEKNQEHQKKTKELEEKIQELQGKNGPPNPQEEGISPEPQTVPNTPNPQQEETQGNQEPDWENNHEGFQRFEDDHEVQQGRFYYNYVSDDTRSIEELNNYCKKEALARFLAVLNLLFEKEETPF